MRSLRILALSGLALFLAVSLIACGGGGSKPVTPVSPPVVTSTVIPSGTVNVPYVFVFTATGGSGTYTWSISAGSLPPGLSLNSVNANLTGTPTQLGSYNYTIQVTDGAGRVGTAAVTQTISGAILITCNSCYAGTNTLPAANPGVPYPPAGTPPTLTASSGTAPYTWCAVETSGTCDNGSQGALPPGLTISTDSNGNGIISGTPTTPGTPSQFSIQVTDSEKIPTRATIALQLTVFGISNTTLPDGVADTNYSQNVVAVGGIARYNWSVTSGSLPPGLSLNNQYCQNSNTPICKIQGIPTQTGTFNFTMQASDGEKPAATASAALSITVDPRISNSALTGNYAFTMTGSKNGNPYIMAGAMIMDGNGNITSGFLDFNDGSGEPIDGSTHRVTPQTINPSGSVYNLGSNGLGTMTIVTNLKTYNFSVVLASQAACVANPTVSTCGRMIESDAAMPGSGVLKVQQPAVFGLSSFFPANLAFLYRGTDPNGKRYAGAGAMGTNSSTLVDIDCSSSNGGNGWGLDGCPSDANYASNPGLFNNVIKGTFSSTIDSNCSNGNPCTGRGDFVNLKFANDPNGYCLGTLSSPSCNYAYYIVDKQEMIIISADPITKPANLTLWQLYRQQSSATGWSLTSLQGTNVVELNGVNPNSGNPQAAVQAGLFVGNGTGGATFNSDENVGGTLSQVQSPSGTYALDTADNGTKSGKYNLSGFTQFGANGAALYMSSPDQASTGAGYIIGSDANVTAGVMEQQIGSPFSNGSVAGGYGGGTSSPVVSGTTDSATFLYADGGGNITANQDTNGPGGPGSGNLTLTYSVDSTGRAVVQNGGQPYGVLYIVSPGKFVMVPDDSAPALNVFSSGPSNN